MLTEVAIAEKPKERVFKKKWLIGAGILLVLLAAFYLLFVILYSGAGGLVSPLGIKNLLKPTEEPKQPNPINGILTLESEVKSWAERYPIGVMIENLNITRPQTGLSRADIVYEALTEGEITRFMGIYLSETTNLGPVRSARLPFLSWVLEYNAALAHVGGSDEALSQIPALGVKNMDQSSLGAPTYERINNRGLDLEHTLFTSTAKLWNKAKDLGWSGVTVFSSWKFKDDQKRETRPDNQKLTLKFTGNLDYIASWIYDPETNLYTRVNGGEIQRDAATNEIIVAKDVIVQFVKTNFQEVTPGKVGRGMITTGGGEARIFRDGISIKGTWVKPTQDSRTKFLDENGAEIELNRGKIWVEVNPTDSPIEYN